MGINTLFITISGEQNYFQWKQHGVQCVLIGDQLGVTASRRAGTALQGQGTEIVDLSKPTWVRGVGRGSGWLGETLAIYTEQGLGSPLPS